MKKLALIILFAIGSSAFVFGQASTIAKGNLSPAETDRIVKKFTGNEGAFREAEDPAVLVRDHRGDPLDREDCGGDLGRRQE